MYKESEDSELRLAWRLFDRTSKLVLDRGSPETVVHLGGFAFSFTINSVWIYNLDYHISAAPVSTFLATGKVFGAYLDRNALIYDMVDPQYCRDHIIPILDRELVLDDLAGI